MRILVTGGSGMVGRNLLADPRASLHELWAPPRREFDLFDAEACLAGVRDLRPDLVIHLAARVGGIAANIAAPADFLADNLAMGVNLLGACRRLGVGGGVNLASSCMYPTGLAGPLREDQLLTGPLETTNEAYALAKLAVWKLACALNREGGSWRTLVATNIYGPHDTFDAVRSHLIAAAIVKIDAALGAGKDEVTIWGDGSARREFLYAPDLADFIWTHVESLEALPETLNVGVGEDHTVDAYHRAVAKVMGYQGAFVHDERRPVGVPRKLLDVSGQARLGWGPATPLVAGLERTVAYFRARATRIGRESEIR